MKLHECQDIYFSSLEFGPENIRSAPSYFHMGRVFQSAVPQEKSGRETRIIVV